MDLSSVVKKLPQLTEDLMTKLVHKLESIGVEGEDDLKLVTESDLSDVLKPIQVRKLLSCWSGAQSSAGLLIYVVTLISIIILVGLQEKND